MHSIGSNFYSRAACIRKRHIVSKWNCTTTQITILFSGANSVNSANCKEIESGKNFAWFDNVFGCQNCLVFGYCILGVGSNWNCLKLVWFDSKICDSIDSNILAIIWWQIELATLTLLHTSSESIAFLMHLFDMESRRGESKLFFVAKICIKKFHCCINVCSIEKIMIFVFEILLTV